MKTKIKLLGLVLFVFIIKVQAQIIDDEISPISDCTITTSFEGDTSSIITVNKNSQTHTLTFNRLDCTADYFIQSNAFGWISLSNTHFNSSSGITTVAITANNTSGPRTAILNFKEQDGKALIRTILITQLDEEDLNWVSSYSYDINENVIGAKKHYFNELGKGTQSQVIDFKTGRTWASQTLYDSQGRPALSTLTAPIRNSGGFLYNSGFIKDENGHTYNNADFENDPENPTPVGDNANSLGRYYSTLNDDNYEEGNDYQDITNRPYSRTIYSELNPGAVIKTIGGNKKDGEWKQGYTFSMPAGNELSQSGAFNDTDYNNIKTIKTVSRDVHGNEVVIFTDTDGKTLAAARVGGETNPTSLITISEQGFVDVHIPVETTGFNINSVSGITTEVYDLITEQITTTATTSLLPGFYRVSITNLDSYNPITGPITIDCKNNYYDYSLNEYDEAGRLTASYQPLNKLKTEYQYNALGQLTYTKSPDEGEAWFKYRKDGQIRFSQNSKQVDPNNDGNISDAEFSYTNYDDLGRPIESGVAAFESELDPDSPTFISSSKKEQQFTRYDDINDTDWDYLNDIFPGYGDPTFLAGNVTKTQNDNSATYYSYDIYGRVKWIVQNINGLGATINLSTKTIDYEYDPITSQVTEVDFQKNVPSERFIHRYTYDAVDNSLTKVETSIDGSIYTTHADYNYYETGALKQVELAKVGGTALQTIDYVYNLNGQLKAINPGNDSNDLFSMQIDYHSSDYSRAERTDIETPNYGQDQFNGNIKGVRWNNKNLEGGDHLQEQTYSYYYNKNNWLTDAVYGQYDDVAGDGSKINIFDDKPHIGVTKNFNATNSVNWLPGFHAQPITGQEVTAKIVTGVPSKFQSEEYNVFDITYDANGNIRTLNRNKNDDGNTAMDQLNYSYDSEKPNQLKRVDDAAGEVLLGKDIGDQDGDNYEYNKIGQLVKNNEENIEYIYNASGLVIEIKKDGDTQVKFFYNDKEHRVKKESYISGNIDYIEHYVRDAAGTTLAIYLEGDVKEHTIYGASRLGVYNRTSATTGNSVYQLTDHLGNVRAVVQKTGGVAAALVATDYYPFGMPMPGRDNGANSYRYKYQGQEKDPETGKEAFQLRLWDSRIGRWLTTDPAGQYSSPYLGMGNNPINGTDPDGAKWEPVVNDDGSTSFVQQKGDTAATLQSQYGLSEKRANDIYATMKKGVISGENVGNGGVLKLDLMSPEGKNEQKRLDHILFASDYGSAHGTSTGSNRFHPADFFTNRMMATCFKSGILNIGADGIGGLTGKGFIEEGGKKIPLVYDIEVYNSNSFVKRNAFEISSFANYVGKGGYGQEFSGNNALINISKISPLKGNETKFIEGGGTLTVMYDKMDVYLRRLNRKILIKNHIKY